MCSGHGQCQDRLLGSGECRCHEGFHGTACEMCELGRYGPNCTGGEPGGRAGEVGTLAEGSGHGDPRAGHWLTPVPPTPSCCQCVTAPMGCARRASAGTEAASATWVGRASAVTRVRSSPPGRGASPGEVVLGSAWSEPSSSYPRRNQWPSVPAEVRPECQVSDLGPGPVGRGAGARVGGQKARLSCCCPPSCVQDSAAAPACVCAAGYSGDGVSCSGPATPPPQSPFHAL